MEISVKKRKARKSDKANVENRTKDERDQIEEAFKLRRKAKRGVYHAVYNAYFNENADPFEILKNPKSLPIEIAYAQHAIKAMETGDSKQLEQICGIVGVATKAKEVEHSVNSDSYTDFLKEASRFLANKRKGPRGAQD
jgi:hypothetical protein